MRHVEEELVHGAETCFVHFCSRTTVPGAFEKFPTGKAVSNIYVNAGANDWYLNGIPGLGSMAESFRALEKIATDAGATRIICIGASMGAFGAAAMASITGRDLVCFGPELWPNIFTGFSRKDLAPGVACDIGALGKPARALIVAGISSPVDVVCAAHFSKLWGADVIYLDDCGHEAARELKARGQLEAMLGDFASGRNLDGYLQMSTKGAMVGRAATMAPADLDASTMLTFVTLLSPHLLAADAIRLVHYLVGRKVFLPALRLLEDIRKQFGEIAEMTLAECTALRKLKRYDEAIRLLKRIERHAFLRTHALFEKAMSLEAMGRREEAAATYGLLVREGTEGAIVRASVARIQALAA